MRTIQEIKSEMAAEWMRNETVQERYGIAPGTTFGDRFGAASVESVLLYVMAACAWTVERLLVEHRSEVTEEIEAMIPHRPKWYRDKVLGFMEGKELKEDSDEYDTAGMSESEIERARVVKHAVAVESRDSSLLTIKVAGEEREGGKRGPLGAEQERALKAYIAEIKDAGVRTALVNMAPDTFNCEVDVYYNAMLQPETVRAECEAAITGYIENLPFNGEYTNMALVDRLQAVSGVRVVEMKQSTAQAANESTLTEIDARITPAAGYFTPGVITVNMKAYNEQAG